MSDFTIYEVWEICDGSPVHHKSFVLRENAEDFMAEAQTNNTVPGRGPWWIAEKEIK